MCRHLVLVRYSIYRSIAILAKVRYRYIVVSRYFNILILFDTYDNYDTFNISIPSIPSMSIPSTSSPFNDVDMRMRNIVDVVDDVVVYGS